MRESVQKIARFSPGFAVLFAFSVLRSLADAAGVVVIFQRSAGGSSGLVGVQKVTPPTNACDTKRNTVDYFR